MGDITIMKNSKKILLLSSMFLLTGCGPDVSLPKNYEEVDTSNVTEVTMFNKKLSTAESITSKAVKTSGVQVKTSLDLDEFAISLGSSSSFIKLKDVSCYLTTAIKSSTGNYNDIAAYVEVSNFDFKFEIASGSTKMSLEAKDIDFEMYIYNGDLYYDASDRDIKTFLYSVVDTAAELSDKSTSKEVSSAKNEIDKALGKKKISGFVSEYGDELFSYFTPSSSLSSGSINSSNESISSITNYASIFTKSLDSILENDQTRKATTYLDYKTGSGVAIGFDSEKLDKSTISSLGANASMDCAFALVYDEDGLFSKYALKCDFELSDSESSILIDDLEYEVTAKYKNFSVKTPTTKDYSAL